MAVLIFVDLDDTLFQSFRKCEAIGQTDNLLPRAYLTNGEVISYATQKQEVLWQMLLSGNTVIPVTARNHDAFSRVDMHFGHEAIINHGGVILGKNKEIDDEWMSLVNIEFTEELTEGLLDLWRQIQSYVDSNNELKIRLVKEYGRFWYIIVKHKKGDESSLNVLKRYLVEECRIGEKRFYLHSNGNNLCIIPEVITKSKAVSFLINRYMKNNLCLTIGMGDSETDIPFMSLCDYSIVPRNTQVGAKLYDK